MPLANIKRRESVSGQGIAELKHRELKTVYSTWALQAGESFYCSLKFWDWKSTALN